MKARKKILSWKHNKKTIVVVLLTLIFLFHAVNNYIVLKKDTTPPLIDAVGHFDNGVKYYQNLRKGIGVFVKDYFHSYSSYPPLFPWSSIPMYWLFGVSADVGVMANVFYFLVLLLSVFFIGKRLGNDTVGLLAAFIVSVFPTIFGLSRVFMLDFALTALVALSICFLLYSNYFRNRLFSILFGIALGLSFLTKWTSPLFVICPLILYLIYSFNLKKFFTKNGFVMYKKPFFNLIVALIIAFLLSLIWLIPNFKGFFAEIIFAGKTLIFQRDFLFYSRILQQQISLVFLLLFIISLLFIIYSSISGQAKFKDSDKKYLLLLALWLLIPLIYLSLLRSMEPRWLAPYLPVFALLIAFGISKIKYVRLRKGIILLVVLLGLLQFFLISYGYVMEQDNQHIYKYGLLSVRTEDWKITDIIRLINKTRNSDSVTIFLTDPLEFSIFPPEQRVLYNFNCDVRIPLVRIMISPELRQLKNLSSYLSSLFKSADYVLYVEAVPAYAGGIQLFISSEIYDLFEENKEKFDKIGEFLLPEDKILILYKRMIYEKNEE